MKTLAIDFDGVLHRYSKGWHDGTCYDEPMPGARAAVEKLAGCYRLVIFTARQELGPVRDWLFRHEIGHLFADVTNVKPKAFAYLDDRALRFRDWPSAINDINIVEDGDTWRLV